MKNNNLAKKVFIGMGIIALAIGINLTAGLVKANAQTSDYGPNGNYYGMMGNFPNSDQFYQEMFALMKKYNVNGSMMGNNYGNYQEANSNSYSGPGYGMMGGRY